MTERYLSCPSCGRLFDPAHRTCPWCGARRPGLFAKLTAWARRNPDGDVVVRAIIVANVAVYIISLLVSRHRGFMMSPLRFLSPDDRSLLLLGATGTMPVFEMGRYWTLISASYLHGGLLHIFFNMMALRQIGPWVSAEYGTSRMFVIYTLTGVIGYLASCFAGVPLTIGASASVCGLIGALFYFGKSRGGRYGTAVSKEVSGWLISLAVFGLIMPGINNWGHGGGAVGGVLLGKLLGYRERSPDNNLHRFLAVVCVIATIIALIPAVLAILGII
ncbi:rhomboid family intramembrane serine protease [Geomonas sp.]|uniref:rhomboid family intramembrane serine protease n=1 Tax=Geomonas sp. TaxID=2651584 RepID=UPI002B495260|nr:rhomboid family intramembrane serine protease [Geomonas sp.]HJV35257.1 rhomboid family intramembrane serine protease [Geomonas sp.]